MWVESLANPARCPGVRLGPRRFKLAPSAQGGIIVSSAVAPIESQVPWTIGKTFGAGCKVHMTE